MDLKRRDSAVQNIIVDYVERVEKIMDKAEPNRLAACYLACICGMWCHSLQASSNVNPFWKIDNTFAQWFIVGYGASRDSVGQNELLNKVFKKHNEEEAAKQAKTEKKSFWQKKS